MLEEGADEYLGLVIARHKAKAMGDTARYEQLSVRVMELKDQRWQALVRLFPELAPYRSTSEAIQQTVIRLGLPFPDLTDARSRAFMDERITIFSIAVGNRSLRIWPLDTGIYSVDVFDEQGRSNTGSTTSLDEATRLASRWLMEQYSSDKLLTHFPWMSTSRELTNPTWPYPDPREVSPGVFQDLMGLLHRGWASVEGFPNLFIQTVKQAGVSQNIVDKLSRDLHDIRKEIALQRQLLTVDEISQVAMLPDEAVAVAATTLGDELERSCQHIAIALDRLRSHGPRISLPPGDLTHTWQHIEDILDKHRGVLASLIDALLVNGGVFVLYPRQLDLSSLVRRVVQQLGAIDRLSGPRIAHEFIGAIPSVRGDEGRIVRVLSRIVDRAAFSTRAIRREGTVHVVLSGEQDQVVCNVVDSGRGMDSGDLTRLHELLQRVGDGTRNPEVLRLDLAFCAAIIRQSGGTLDVISQGLDSGTTVTIRLPQAGTD